MQRKYWLPLFLLLEIIVVQILSFFPEWMERWYSTGLYIWISDFSRISLGKIPFSVGDCGYALLIVLLVRWFWKKRGRWQQDRKQNFLQVANVLAVFYFFFYLLWGMNYSRQPLFEKMHIERDYTDQELLVFTKKLIAKTNAVQFEIMQNPTSKIVFPYSQDQVFSMNLNGYKNLAEHYPFFSYNHLSVKKSLFSLPLTYMGFGGYLNPFTNEAQVNYLGPMYVFPATTCHEMAHQMGYASESECNFIGFLASVKNRNLYFQYSGYCLALRYCMGNWSVRNPEILKELLKTIHPGVLLNFKESKDFWKQYETFVEKGFLLLYDRFLKLNQQKDGMEGYSKFLNLLVNYYKDKPL